MADRMDSALSHGIDRVGMLACWFRSLTCWGQFGCVSALLVILVLGAVATLLAGIVLLWTQPWFCWLAGAGMLLWVCYQGWVRETYHVLAAAVWVILTGWLLSSGMWFFIVAAVTTGVALKSCDPKNPSSPAE